ncbi:g7729 [Coccomyxa viridis]|uniref:Glutaredoxin-dependent peroxiredoxin n=1 Tax=Coccomyxa viridis TaxID=1274662 RepID=A0ABP1G587_9CHLO
MPQITMNRVAAPVMSQNARLLGQQRHAVLPMKAALPRKSRRSTCCKTQALAQGDKLPGDVKLNYFDKENNMQEISIEELTKGKKVIMLAVPGAFTPTCSMKHLPGFVEKYDEIKAKGVDTIACVGVNDAFVMDAWGKSIDVGDKILLLADGSAIFTKAIGAELDLTDKGLGIRSRRYTLLAEDGVVKALNLEEGGAFTVSSADNILAGL